jgi:hypothetical protein
VIYHAKVNANFTFGDDVEATNRDLTQLVTLGYLPEWPANPLNDWQAMKVLTATDPFAQGEIVLEVCPDSEQTTFASKALHGSFNLYVSGLEGAELEPVKTGDLGPNKGWGHPPAKALYHLQFLQLPMRSEPRPRLHWNACGKRANCYPGNPQAANRRRDSTRQQNHLLLFCFGT